MPRRLKILACALVSLPCARGTAAEPPSYDVFRAAGAIVVDGRLDEPAWQAAPSVGPFVFPWHTAGDREQTDAKLLWDDENLYVSFVCQDAHISVEQTEHDAPVYQDDCVEVFTSPDPARTERYFNIEMNVGGAFLDRYHPNGPGQSPEWDASGVKIATSVLGTLNNDDDQDQSWTLEAAIPFSNFASVAKRAPPRDGDMWRLNLNRLGGKVNAQHSQWSRGMTPRPSFHTPDTFGQVHFRDSTPPARRSP